MKRFLSFLFLFALSYLSLAQTAMISGKIMIKNTDRAISDLEVTIVELKQLITTGPDGTFSFTQVPYGNYKLEIGDGNFVSEVVLISADKELVDIGSIEVVYNDKNAAPKGEQLPTIGFEENALSGDDDGQNNQSFSAVLSASRDPFLSAATFTFGPLRYQLRGYQRDEMEVFINGIPVNDVESGSASWSQWGGLNDVFRNQSISFALDPNEYGFGGLQGGIAIDATAASQRMQTRLTYSLSNRGYRHRIMLTKSSGLMQNGWAYSFSASTRLAREGYIPGTFYEGYSMFMAISKKLSANSTLNLTAFGAPSRRGKSMPATQEVLELAGNNYYNPNWGYLAGEKRNARVSSSFQPIAILSYERTRTNREFLNIAASYTEGYNSNTALDWYNAQDPRPDYYRKLPSHYLNNPSGLDTNSANALGQYFLNDPNQLQIDWGRLYGANQNNIETVNGMTGRRSVYIIGADIDYTRKISLATNYKKVVGAHLKTFTGIYLQYQHTHSYKRMEDLLGGDFIVNLNQFAERSYIGNTTFNQNNLLNSNELIRRGDIYSYNYKVNFIKANYYLQVVGNYNKFDFFLAGKIGYDQFQRNGLYQNGLFADDSYGKSIGTGYLTYGLKGGLTYKINGRNYLYVNASYQTNAPTFDNTFISPRTRNIQLSNPQTEAAQTLEAGYLIHSPNINGRLSGFVTDQHNITDIKRFYHEDFRSFVNYVMTNVAIRNLGAELAIQAKISPSLSATAVATWTQVFYTDRPTISIYRDNDTNTRVERSIVYMKDYFVGSGPQSAYTVGFNYRSPKFWYASVNLNYLDRNYLDINPTRLTEDALGLLDRNSPKAARILEQTKLPSSFTIDLFAGKSFSMQQLFKKLSRDHFFYLNVGVNNVLNNKEIIISGYNQLRYDYASQNPDRFPPKYAYGLGINFFLNLSYKF